MKVRVTPEIRGMGGPGFRVEIIDESGESVWHSFPDSKEAVTRALSTAQEIIARHESNEAFVAALKDMGESI